MSQDLLRVRNLDAFYERAQVLFDVELSVAQGEVVALLGRNGAGKSTLFKAIMGLVRSSRGCIEFMGHDIQSQAPYRIARRGLGYVPQERRIFAELTVDENLELGRKTPSGAPGPIEAQWSSARIYRIFPHLATMVRRRADSLSGGEQQLLTFARALMGNPILLLLDEPTEGIAPHIVTQMEHVVKTLKAHGASVFLSEQNIHFAERVATRVYVLEKGQVKFQGAMANLVADESLRVAHLAL